MSTPRRSEASRLRLLSLLDAFALRLPHDLPVALPTGGPVAIRDAVVALGKSVPADLLDPHQAADDFIGYHLADIEKYHGPSDRLPPYAGPVTIGALVAALREDASRNTPWTSEAPPAPPPADDA